jgi:hypothetical protein
MDKKKYQVYRNSSTNGNHLKKTKFQLWSQKTLQKTEKGTVEKIIFFTELALKF